MKRSSPLSRQRSQSAYQIHVTCKHTTTHTTHTHTHRKDDDWGAWCASAAGAAHPRRRQLCDPTSDAFGAAPAALAGDNETVLIGPEFEAAWGDKAALRASWRRLEDGADSAICEMLGSSQRGWLREVLSGSGAALKLVGSGSVLAGTLVPEELSLGVTSDCDGDDWSCYGRAQVRS